MSEHGATLQTYNQELVKCLEDLKVKKKTLFDIVHKQELEKTAIEKNIRILKEKLDHVNEELEKHKAVYESYERAIEDTEKGFRKILESSQILLNLAQQEANKLNTYNKNQNN